MKTEIPLTQGQLVRSSKMAVVLELDVASQKTPPQHRWVFEETKIEILSKDNLAKVVENEMS